MKKGRLITFEGVDGAGKSSHVPWLVNLLINNGIANEDIVMTREPGGTPLGEKLRTILINDPMHGLTEALMMFAARKEHVEQVIMPALKRGAWVISDRFTDSSFAYQGGGRGVSITKLRVLEKMILDDFKPDLTFLFDLPIEVAQARMSGTREKDKFEVENYDFHMRVKTAFLDRAWDDRPRIRVIDANQDIDYIRQDLIKHLQDFQNNILELGQLA